MLLACNPFDIVHSDKYYGAMCRTFSDNDLLCVVDTDDFVAQTILAGKLKNYLKDKRLGLTISNLVYSEDINELYVTDTNQYDLKDWLDAYDVIESNINITLRYIDEFSYNIEFKNNIFTLIKKYNEENGNFEFFINDEVIYSVSVLCSPDEDYDYDWRISYAVKLKDYFIVCTCIVDSFNDNCPNCIVLGFKDAKLMSVLSDSGDNERFIKNKKYRDNNFLEIYKHFKSKMKIVTT